MSSKKNYEIYERLVLSYKKKSLNIQEKIHFIAFITKHLAFNFSGIFHSRFVESELAKVSEELSFISSEVTLKRRPYI